jgi:hypothetical protein
VILIPAGYARSTGRVLFLMETGMDYSNHFSDIPAGLPEFDFHQCLERSRREIAEKFGCKCCELLLSIQTFNMILYSQTNRIKMEYIQNMPAPSKETEIMNRAETMNRIYGAVFILVDAIRDGAIELVPSTPDCFHRFYLFIRP